MQIWQDLFFRDSNQSLTQICLHIINENRLGRLMNASLVRLVVQSYSKHFIDRLSNECIDSSSCCWICSIGKESW